MSEELEDDIIENEEGESSGINWSALFLTLVGTLFLSVFLLLVREYIRGGEMLKKDPRYAELYQKSTIEQKESKSEDQ